MQTRYIVLFSMCVSGRGLAKEMFIVKQNVLKYFK